MTTTTLDKIQQNILSPDNALALLPESKEIARKIPSPLLFQLEQAGEIATEILDERVTAWAEEGWTQRRMADEIGCSPSSVSDRLKRLGVKTKDPRGGAREFARSPSKTEPLTDEERDRLNELEAKIERGLADMEASDKAREEFRARQKTGEVWTEEDTRRVLRIPGVYEGVPLDLVEKAHRIKHGEPEEEIIEDADYEIIDTATDHQDSRLLQIQKTLEEIENRKRPPSVKWFRENELLLEEIGFQAERLLKRARKAQ
jgi:hypothetical protein